MALAAWLVSCAAPPSHNSAALRPRDVPGPRADGSVRLPNLWSLKPAGKQISLGDFPVNVAVHPKGRFAAVLHCGYGQHEIIVVEIATGKLVSRAALEEAFYGVTFSADGTRLFASGAGTEAVYDFGTGMALMNWPKPLGANAT